MNREVEPLVSGINIKKLKRALSFLYYYYFSLNMIGVKLLYYINPVSIIARMKFRHDPERLENYKNAYFGTFDNPKNGLGDYISFGGVFITVFILLDGISLILLGLMDITIEPDYLLFVIMLIITYTVIQLLVFRKNYYLKHFQKFKKSDNTFRYIYTTLLIVLIIYLNIKGLNIYSRN